MPADPLDFAAALRGATAAECVSALAKTVLTPRGALLDDLGICVCRRRP